MKKVDLLKIKSLFKQLEYLSSEIEWKEEQLEELQIEFNIEIQSILEEYPELKEMYDDKFDIDIKKILENKLKPEESSTEIVEKDPKMKKLYREIVKKTHPDKITDERLNDIYINANEKYNNNDQFGIYQICDQLGINFEFDEEEKEKLENSIETYKNRIGFLNTSYVWSFYHLKDPLERREAVKEYIVKQFS